MQQESAKKWFIPVIALVLIGAIAVATWHFVLNKPHPGQYKIYVIAPGDNGKKGSKVACNDSLVPVAFQNVSNVTISDVYQDLVGLHSYNYDNGLTNPIGGLSDLNVDLAVVGSDGVAHINLTGTLNKVSSCDAARITAQLTKTAYQFSGVKSVNVTVNGKPLDQALQQ